MHKQTLLILATCFACFALSANARCQADATPDCTNVGCAAAVPVPCPSGTSDCCKTPNMHSAYTCYENSELSTESGSVIVPVGGSHPQCPTGWGATATCDWCSGETCFIGCWCSTRSYGTHCRKTHNCAARTTGVCGTCSGGFYKHSDGTCQVCVAGNKCVGGGSAACPAGTTSGAGATTCSPCASGHISTAGSATCTQCTGTTYANTEATECLACPTGKACSNGVLEQCEPGDYVSDDGSECIACPAGFRCIGGLKHACEFPTYQNSGGQSVCLACPTAEVDQFATGCGGTSPGTINACKSSCGTGQFLDQRCAPGTVGSDTSVCRSCIDHAAATCLTGQFLNGCGNGANSLSTGACSDCANSLTVVPVCPGMQYLKVQCAPGAVSDVSNCEPCTDCGTDSGQYTSGCGGDSPGSCAACVTCEDHQIREGCGDQDPGRCVTQCGLLNETTGQPWFEVSKATPSVDTLCWPCANFTSASQLYMKNALNESVPSDASREWERICYRAPSEPGWIQKAADSLGMSKGAFVGTFGTLIAMFAVAGASFFYVKNRRNARKKRLLRSQVHEQAEMMNAEVEMTVNPLLTARPSQLDQQQLLERDELIRQQQEEIRRMKEKEAKAEATNVTVTGRTSVKLMKKEFGNTNNV